MPLTDTKIKNTKPSDKAQKLFDGGGLFLYIPQNGGKNWRLKYRFAGKEKLLSLGTYPGLSLKEARAKRDEAKKQLADGIDPGEMKKVMKHAQIEQAENSFERVAREWFLKFEPKWSKGHSSKIITRLQNDIFPWIGSRPITEISAPELLGVLQRIESRGAIETAHRAKQSCGQVFRYAIATGRAERDPSADLKGALAPPQAKHHASITDPRQIGELMRAIESYQGHVISRTALRSAPYLFVRPGELRHAEWEEIDLDHAVWHIPGEKMKAGEKHVVPLSTQAVDILRDIYPLTGRSRYVFPSVRTNSRPMSENTLNAALRRMGYTKEQMTAHGFRSMASTILNEQGWHKDAIERQLAHAERDNVRAAYNYAEHLPERTRMMQSWADYLDGLKKGAEIIPLLGKKADR